MNLLIIYLALLVALVVHEFSHAFIGFLQGDHTAKQEGRLTLNPIAHIDPIGTVILPLLAMFSGFPVIGWAKPVPFNPYNLRNRKWGPVFVALAGPLSNFTMAIFFAVILNVLIAIGLPLANLLTFFIAYLIIINIVLGIFNFIPVPPLDGSKLIAALLDSPKYHRVLLFLETRGPLLLFLFIMLDFWSPKPILGTLFQTVIQGAFSVAGLTDVLFAL